MSSIITSLNRKDNAPTPSYFHSNKQISDYITYSLVRAAAAATLLYIIILNIVYNVGDFANY